MAQVGTRACALALLVLCLSCGEDKADSVTATAYLRGDNVIIALESSEPFYTITCVDLTKLETRVGERWQPLRSDGPADFHDGYYYDDVYVTPTVGFGCDVQMCIEGSGGANLGPPVEVIASGTRAAPDWVESAHAADPAPVFVTEPVSGLVRAELTYFTDEDCTAPETVSFELEIPEDGVCCPVGDEGCSSEGPKGGWAPSLENCDPWNGVAGEYALMFTDNRGCPALRNFAFGTANKDIPVCTR